MPIWLKQQKNNWQGDGHASNSNTLNNTIVLVLLCDERERKPGESVAMMEQDARELASGIEVGPIDGGARVRMRELKERVEFRVERSQKSKVW